MGSLPNTDLRGLYNDRERREIPGEIPRLAGCLFFLISPIKFNGGCEKYWNTYGEEYKNVAP
jgi:hypothetical protein